MEIGYSVETLWLAICKQMADVKSEAEWLRYYTAKREVDCVEDCAKNIIDSCKAILENIEHLKGEPM
jgi:hypothetical protein